MRYPRNPATGIWGACGSAGGVGAGGTDGCVDGWVAGWDAGASACANVTEPAAAIAPEPAIRHFKKAFINCSPFPFRATSRPWIYQPRMPSVTSTGGGGGEGAGGLGCVAGCVADCVEGWAVSAGVGAPAPAPDGAAPATRTAGVTPARMVFIQFFMRISPVSKHKFGNGASTPWRRAQNILLLLTPEMPTGSKKFRKAIVPPPNRNQML